MELALRRQWTDFLAAYRPDVDDTAAARCNFFAARLALGRVEGLADEVATAWLNAKSLPDACDPAFDWLKVQGKLTPQLIERRARMALASGESGLARHLARSLPETTAAPLTQWAALIEQPRAAIEGLVANPTRTVEPEALLDGWTRYARADAEAAAGRYAAFVESRSLDARAASPHALAVALALSWGRHDGALEFFSRTHAEDFDERAHEWHARAALWAGDWTRTRKAIEAMPEPLRSQNRWRYWHARASGELGEEEVARQGYAAVLPTDNWYAVLSAARLGVKFAPTLQPLELNDDAMPALASEPAFVRTRELVLCEMQEAANLEWGVANELLTPSQRTQAVGLASRWGWHLPAIAAAARLGLFNDYELLYPRPYDAEVRHAASRARLSEDLVYAIIRQESLYRADAGSSAGALGLMQLLPSTARITARRWGLPAPTRASLLVPSVNVPLGAAHLRDLIDGAGDQQLLAVAGYNAGPAAARRWLPSAPMEADVWVENIPFNETRAYVQRVSWHELVFAWLGDRKPRDVSSWLRVIRKPAEE
jgi:soluble lytic murein transglycosylase